MKTNLLKFTDMRDNPERFFEAHRLLSKRLVGGFGIRFTVQYNLFAGSILGLGGEAQVARELIAAGATAVAGLTGAVATGNCAVHLDHCGREAEAARQYDEAARLLRAALSEAGGRPARLSAPPALGALSRMGGLPPPFGRHASRHASPRIFVRFSRA